jgi:hypothetical protein
MIPLAYLDWPDEGTTTTTTTAAPTTSSTTTSSTTTGATTTSAPTTGTTTAAPCLNTYEFTFFDGGCNYLIRDCNGNPIGNIRVTSCNSPGTDSTGATIPGCSQLCPTEPPPTTTSGPTTTSAPTTTTAAPTTTTTTAAPCNCSQFDNQCPPGFTATCDSNCNFTGVCFG